MRGCQLMRQVKHALALTALCAFGSLGFAAVSAAATNADACGAITQHDMAKAFGLTDAIPHHTVLREPGNPAGVIHVRCHAFSWSGKKPNDDAQRKARVPAGTVATLRIDTWVPDQGPFEAIWRNNFQAKLEDLRSRARSLYLEGSRHGKSFQPPRFTAEGAIGYQAVVGGVRTARVFWWNRGSGSLIAMNILESPQRPLRRTVRSLAERIVPAVG